MFICLEMNRNFYFVQVNIFLKYESQYEKIMD